MNDDKFCGMPKVIKALADECITSVAALLVTVATHPLTAHVAITTHPMSGRHGASIRAGPLRHVVIIAAAVNILDVHGVRLQSGPKSK